MLGLACLFIVVFVKKRFICIYNFLSQLSILLKNPPQKWIFVSFVFVCNLSVIIVCFRYKRVWEQSLFEQRNLHWQNQWLQLQLLSRICRQPMRNWWDTCCCQLHCISAKSLIQLATYPFKHLKKVLNTVECWWPINMDQF